MVICGIIGIINPVMLVMWATGVFGFYALPISFYYMFFTFLDGSSLLSTVLFAIMMRQKVRSAQQSFSPLPQRSIWEENRVSILVLSLLLVGGDFAAGVIVICSLDKSSAMGSSLTVGGLLFFFSFSNLFIGIYFLVQAIYLKKYLDRYLRMRLELSTAGTGTGFTVMDPIKRTTSILFINGAYLILCTLLKFWEFYELRLGVPSPERILILGGAY